ncbi:major facilitator superfamily domain-containing protein [Talaromyces proteolyticus]|uniref:Major facilitator superfamily domain-containing protein n=1 Tax=Talaromyces proteolyticus TaxID=1131652 RepID=A0AAD4Q3B1_9EURO|nr:major facilitator superfamily domain-containing protein [Talaromyces proteolyticus]KAH8701558.1 major facilitator superfamily domain-containing protein [Talaromyces proteolyticus]
MTEIDYSETPDIEPCEKPSQTKVTAAHRSGLDDALQMALDGQDESWTKEEERRVLWKIDLTIVPLLFLGTVIGYADSQAYGFAALFGLVQDLELFTLSVVNGQLALDTTKYQLSAGITSLGGAAGQYLLLFLAQLLPAGIVYGVMLVYAGLLALLTVICHNFSQIMALRFFYGFTQIQQPLAIIITVMWWKTREQPLRLGIVIAGNALGSLIGNGVDFGAINLSGQFSNSRWKWIYIILGSCGLCAGIIIILFLPATPMKAWFLTPRERRIAVRRLMSNNTGIHTRKFKFRQAISAFLDPQLYALCVFTFTFAFSNVAVSSFGGFLVTSFGYSETRALVLALPASAVAVVCIIAAGMIGNRFPNHRIIVAIVFILPSMVGNIMLWKTRLDSKAALLGGLYISTTFYGSLVQHYSLLAANVAGHSKKTAVMATITIMAALGGFSGPWAYKGDQSAEGYPDGQIATLSLFCASILAYIILWVYYSHCNKKRTALLREQPGVFEDPMIAFMDLTDRENLAFRYTL